MDPKERTSTERSFGSLGSERALNLTLLLEHHKTTHHRHSHSHSSHTLAFTFLTYIRIHHTYLHSHSQHTFTSHSSHRIIKQFLLLFIVSFCFKEGRGASLPACDTHFRTVYTYLSPRRNYISRDLTFDCSHLFLLY